MIVTSTPTQDDLYIMVRDFLVQTMGSVEIIQGLGSRAPTPLGEFIAITAVTQSRLGNSNINTYDDPYPLDGSKKMMSKIQYGIQIDCFGETSSDKATQIVTLMRDDLGIELLQCLYCSEPTQAPLTSGEENYVQRWMITAEFQVNFEVAIKQEFFDTVGIVELIEVDTHFPAT